ncbi:MAG TPA: hypothetical protein VIQ03_00390, partial [Gammaproteobacteria bacterium]
MRLRYYASLLGLLMCSAVLGADEDKNPGLRDLFFGEALFHAYQDEYFTAITRLDTELGQYYALDEPALDPFHFHIKQAEFSVGDLELSYRMHQRAGRAIKAVLEGDVRPEVRNEAAYRLAKIYMQKNEPVNALHILESMTDKIPERIRVDEAYLRSQVYITTGKFAEAVMILQDLLDEDSLEGFAGYNLGIALIQNGQEKEGVMQLEKVGTLSSND